MTITRKISTAATVALLASAGTAAAADAPVVSSQKTLSAKTAPVTVPGTGIKKGQRLPSGARVVYRDVTLEGRQTVRLSLRARRQGDPRPCSRRARRLRGSRQGRLHRSHEGQRPRFQGSQRRR
jgi:hypothetical protein